MTNDKHSANPTVDFLLAGATKAATSSIYEYFHRHPDVVALPEDQYHYFSSGIFGEHYHGLEREVESLADYRALLPQKPSHAKLGDFDRLTLHGPRAPELVKGVNPKAKVMLILRNPLERAYSHYWMDVRECFETRPFFQAVREDHLEYAAGSSEYCPLIRLGYYAEQIRRFQNTLGAEQVRVWLYDDFCADSGKVFKEMCEFIGVDYVPVPEAGEIRENVAAVPRSWLSAMLLRARLTWLRPARELYIKLPRGLRRYVKNRFLTRRIKVPPMPAEAKRFLTEIYKSDILELEKLLGCDLAHWLRDPANPLALPPEFQELQKAKQAEFFDHHLDEEFEIERPAGAGRLYEWSIETKFRRALGLASFPLKGVTVLDICCGSGMGAEIYVWCGARVTGLDISDRSIARARERAKRHGFAAEFVTGDAENLPFPDQSFDVVTVHDGLHHLPNPHKAVAEMARVARKAIIVIEPARSWLTQQAVTAGWALDYEAAGNYVYRFREDKIFQIAERAGFKRLRYAQYLLYYQHKPFAWAKRIENTPLFYLFPFAFGTVSLLAPRLGNKLCVVCERPPSLLRSSGAASPPATPAG